MLLSSDKVSLDHIELAFDGQLPAPGARASTGTASQNKKATVSSLPNQASRTRASGTASKQNADADMDEGNGGSGNEEVVSDDDSDSDGSDDQGDINLKGRADFIINRFRRMLSTSHSQRFGISM